MTKHGLLDGVFYLRKRAGCKDQRTFSAMKITDEYPRRLYGYADLKKLEKNDDGSWTMILPDGREIIAEQGSYWIKYERFGEEPECGVIEKGGLEYYDFNVCSESGIVIGHLPMIDPV